jgi:prefoldin subunit 5
MDLNFSGTLDEFKALFSDAAIMAQLHEVSQSIAALGINQGNLMATLQDVKDTIAAERQQVSDGIAALTAQIATLTAQLQAGTVVTAQDLADLQALISDIFTPTPPTVPVP